MLGRSTRAPARRARGRPHGREGGYADGEQRHEPVPRGRRRFAARPAGASHTRAAVTACARRRPAAHGRSLRAPWSRPRAAHDAPDGRRPMPPPHSKPRGVPSPGASRRLETLAQAMSSTIAPARTAGTGVTHLPDQVLGERDGHEPLVAVNAGMGVRKLRAQRARDARLQPRVSCRGAIVPRGVVKALRSRMVARSARCPDFGARITEGRSRTPTIERLYQSRASDQRGIHAHKVASAKVALTMTARPPRMREDTAAPAGVEDLEKRRRDEEGTGEVGASRVAPDSRRVHGTHGLEHGPVPRNACRSPPDSAA